TPEQDAVDAGRRTAPCTLSTAATPPTRASRSSRAPARKSKIDNKCGQHYYPLPIPLSPRCVTLTHRAPAHDLDNYTANIHNYVISFSLTAFHSQRQKCLRRARHAAP